MKFVFEREPHSRLAHFKIIFRKGSLSDETGKYGQAHLTAKTLFRGSKQSSYQVFNFELEKMGVRLSVDEDYEYFSIMATVIQERFAEFIDSFMQALQEPIFEEDQLKQVRQQTLSDLRSDLQDPKALVVQALFQHSFQGNRFEFPSDGSEAGLGSVQRADVISYYRELFQAEAIIGLVASLDEDKARRILNPLFSLLNKKALKKSSDPRLNFWDGTGRQALVVERGEMATAPLVIALRGLSDADARLPALEVSNFVLGGDFTSRLMRRLRIEKGWTYGVSSGFQQILSPSRHWGLFSIYTFPSSEFFAETLKETLSCCEEFFEKGMTRDELERAQSSMMESYAFDLETGEKRLSLKLRQELTGRPYLSDGEHRELIQSFSLDQVHSYIREALDFQNLRMAVVGDAEKLSPILDELQAFESIQTVDVLI